MELELRMYGLVPYNISPIQQAIQFGHGVVEYGQSVKGMGEAEKLYNTWANKYKTFIIKNGGTTNDSPDYNGSMQIHRQALTDAGISFEVFREPDLNNALTAIVFIVDERVFNKELYPDFVPSLLNPDGMPSDRIQEMLDSKNERAYKEWVISIGGKKNAFLREYINPIRLA